MTIFITGASRGLGLEFTKLALEKGHEVYAFVRNPNKAAQLQELKSSGRLTLLQGDVTSADDIARAAKDLQGKTIDILINNAGILDRDEGPFESLSLESIQKTFDVNTLGPIRVTQALLPNLRNSQKPIVANLTSKMGSIADNSSGGDYAYRISKTALNMFAKSFSIDFPNIITLVLHPGWAKTDMGGPRALVEAKDSVAGLFQIIENATPSQSGHFYEYTGKEIPW